jgi:hypothetical protein
MSKVPLNLLLKCAYNELIQPAQCSQCSTNETVTVLNSVKMQNIILHLLNIRPIKPPATFRAMLPDPNALDARLVA